MADIEVVIKIPEEMWERIKDGYVPLGISKYLKNGTPLPEGHGRLIDVSEYFKKEFGDAREFLDNATTIIEADKAESEDRS